MALHCTLYSYKIKSYTKYDILHVRDDLWSKASGVMSNIPKGITVGVNETESWTIPGHNETTDMLHLTCIYTDPLKHPPGQKIFLTVWQSEI